MSPAARAVLCAAALLLAGPGAARAEVAGKDVGSAAALAVRYAALTDKLAYNQFRRPLYLDSHERPDGVTGEIHARVDYPFATSGSALSTASQWCEILMLHLNTKSCRPAAEGAEMVLKVRIGRKFDQAADKAHGVDFVYRVVNRSADYLHVKLSAAKGPLDTSDYRIALEAVPVAGGQTFIRLSYSYSYGLLGRLAMQTYLATLARDKVGFTLVGKEPGGQPHYIGGTRAVVERNTMRYYLAIEAYLGALSTPPQERLEKRLRDWFAACERFPRQLHEMEQGAYLAMKRKENGV